MVGPLGTSIRAYRPKSGLQDAASLKKRKESNNYKLVSVELQRRGLPSAKATPPRLAQIVADIRQFLEEHFGRDSQRSDTDKTMTIFPSRIFKDFAENGAVVCMLDTIFNYAAQNSFDPDFSKDGDVDKCYETLEHVDKILKENNYIRTVKAFLSPKLPERESKKLHDALLRHGAAILSTPHVATHIIYPDPPGTRESQTDDQVLCRMLSTSTHSGENECFVHWMHHPDSYDDWVPRDEVLGHVFTPVKRTIADQWHISARWVRDLEVYNEWMNELDYEMPEDFDDYIGRPPTDPKEARLISKYSRVRLRLRQPVEEKPLDESNDFGMVGLPTIGADAVSMEIDDFDPTTVATEVEEELLEEGQFSGPTPRESGEQSDANDGNGKVAVANGVYMPSFATWFDTDEVHDIERRALPEFFSGKFSSKTESTYREIRNFMIRTWRRSKIYLSGTAARRHLAGDACAIFRVHGFLEHWGLINYGCEDAPQGSFNPPPKALPLNAGIEDDIATKKNPILLLDNGTRAELKGSKILKQDCNGEPLVEANSSNFLIRESERTGHSQIADVEVREPIEYHCDSCGIDCSKLRFHCATKADVDLCASCYRNGRYASTMKHRDFIQMTSAGQFGGPEAVDPDVWTESETLLLLEALEMYSDNWQLVSEHVGSKDKNQCVTHFLRLPIEDTFLNTTRKRWWGENPSEGDSLPSPTEIMRTAGARETSLAAATAKGPTAKAYSGQPLVFGDQISTIVPFVSSLANLSSPSMLRELTSVMDCDGPRRRVRRPFVNVMKNRSAQWDGSSEQLAGEDEEDDADISLVNTSVSAAQILSGSVYQELNRSVKQPAEILNSEYGRAISKAVAGLVKDGSMESDDITNLKFESSAHNIHNTCTQNSTAANGDEAERQENDDGSPPPETSPTAVATAALSAACVTAAQRRAVEEVELDRLLSIVLEIRMEFVRRKIAHLKELTRHIKFSEQVERRKRLAQMEGTVTKKLRHLEGGEFARSSRLIRSVDGDGLVSTLCIKEVDGVVEQAKSWTERGWAQAERKKTSLPNFEDTDGEESEREGEDGDEDHMEEDEEERKDGDDEGDEVMEEGKEDDAGDEVVDEEKEDDYEGEEEDDDEEKVGDDDEGRVETDDNGKVENDDEEIVKDDDEGNVENDEEKVEDDDEGHEEDDDEGREEDDDDDDDDYEEDDEDVAMTDAPSD